MQLFNKNLDNLHRTRPAHRGPAHRRPPHFYSSTKRYTTLLLCHAIIYKDTQRMTNTFLKRRGGGDGCSRKEASGLWAFSCDFCSGGRYNTGFQSTTWFSLDYIHAQTHAHTPRVTHMLWCCHGLMHWLFDGLCDVLAGLHRGQSCRRGHLQPQQSVHDERVTALWPSGLQLIGRDYCNGNSSGDGCKKKI